MPNFFETYLKAINTFMMLQPFVNALEEAEAVLLADLLVLLSGQFCLDVKRLHLVAD